MHDVLFTSIEKLHNPLPFGRLLDAGTGVSSLRWIQTINTTSWVAVTADTNMQSMIMSDAGVAAGIRPACDKIVVGNWMNDQFCDSLGMYDTILADYLIGAVDGFSPFAQDLIIQRLKRHLNPQGRLYLVGMQPIPDHASGAAEVITEVRRARDACILLAGHRPYREYPVDWIKRHMEREGLRVLGTKSFNILHTAESAQRQIRVAQTKLSLMPSSVLRAGMTTYLQELTSRVETAMAGCGGKIPLSFDYIIAAEHDQQATENLGASIFSLLSSPFSATSASASASPADAADAAGASSGDAEKAAAAGSSHASDGPHDRDHA